MRTKTNAAAVLEACGEVSCPVPIDPVSVQVSSVPWWVRIWWRGPFEAITLPWAVYLRHEALQSPENLRNLMVHELVHVEQWRHLGVRRFLTRYVGEYLRARRSGLDHMSAYRDISLEVEARIVAGES